MIEPHVVNRIRRSTCAVSRLSETHEDLAKKIPIGGSVSRPKADVVGTGFLIREDLVLTNRHVVESIAHEHEQLGDHGNWYLEFVFPREGGGIATSYRRAQNVFALVDPDGHGRVDVGMISFNKGNEIYTPVEFGNLDAVVVGNEVATCGFPRGNEILRGDLGIFRFGPVVHRGMISGVAPFETSDPRRLTAFLTDLNSAGGMSGSPVFTVADGRVIGLHFGGAQGTFGFALPIDRLRVDSWIRFYERVIVRGETSTDLQMSDGGDIIE